MARLDPTLTRRMRAMLELAPVEWETLRYSSADPTVVSLENRGLVELRVNPSYKANEVVIATHLNWNGHWQWRKVPEEK